MKCLPASKLTETHGNGIHDWHAEVLAIRAFNNFALEECKAVAQGRMSDIFSRRDVSDISGDPDTWHGQPYCLREGVYLYMYCSEVPCTMISLPYMPLVLQLN
jgi:tRNA-specific adenosine deaminase 1